MERTRKPKTVLAYIMPEEALLLTARKSGLHFADSPAGYAWVAMATEAYRRFERFGPVELHFILINGEEPGQGEGAALVLGYPNQGLDAFPQLSDLGVHVFRSQPRLLTRVGTKGDDWTSPTEDGTGVDSIMMVQQEPLSSNWSRSNRFRRF
ncbi:unnamed protein product [Rhizoctonia solani]|uniref:Uncharacterized protein n=3 Tax=Rhizoctonia solani TaxID=456999 RepID=A0A8H3A8F0_9AGAM|nr:hypothetical protein RSOL_314950 [Rhizoctonia solani AG-3 Rhs1AP]KEP46510.1 hypothetical protein V565_195050 [Rhizoctonia solani 123E]CAE6406740.1 unnamed protein product [Rhizoctonia solani]